MNAMPSIIAQVQAIQSRPVAARPSDDPLVKNRPSAANIDKAAALLSDVPITSAYVREQLCVASSTAQACLRILCEEQGRAKRVRNGPRGAKGYVLNLERSDD